MARLDIVCRMDGSRAGSQAASEGSVSAFYVRARQKDHSLPALHPCAVGMAQLEDVCRMIDSRVDSALTQFETN